jgi:hypothetical protein
VLLLISGVIALGWLVFGLAFTMMSGTDAQLMD